MHKITDVSSVTPGTILYSLIDGSLVLVVKFVKRTEQSVTEISLFNLSNGTKYNQVFTTNDLYVNLEWRQKWEILIHP